MSLMKIVKSVSSARISALCPIASDFIVGPVALRHSFHSIPESDIHIEQRNLSRGGEVDMNHSLNLGHAGASNAAGRTGASTKVDTCLA